MHVKEMPGRVETFPVIKGTFLGWLGDLPQGPGYACFVITHDRHVGNPNLAFRAHLMCAAGLDKPWKAVKGWANLTHGTANNLLYTHEKMAVWPERN